MNLKNISNLENNIPDINYIMDRVIKQYIETENSLFEKCLRTVAEPPIKGKITKEKIKWRGIKIYQSSMELGKSPERWLMQRGKQISPKIIISVPQFNNFNVPKH